jgi:phosphatidylethanolamine/phosphatidyl-N-methylethanolamine N-methyltransferase
MTQSMFGEALSTFGIRHSFVIRASSVVILFVIRHSPPALRASPKLRAVSHCQNAKKRYLALELSTHRRASIMHYWTECQQFYRQFRDQYHTTGSIMPSSRALARAMTRPMRQCAGPRRILEIGPGTGAITAAIVRQLRPGDQFDVVEINADFVALLGQRFSEEPEFRKRRAQTRILHSPLQDVPGEAVYDFMISGLPLNNFSLALVADIYKSYERLLKPAGTLTSFEYVWIRQMKMPFVSPAERDRLTQLTQYLEAKIRRHQIGEEIVFLNVPPAVARHLRFGGKD